jgi:hypothetical protein
MEPWHVMLIVSFGIYATLKLASWGVGTVAGELGAMRSVEFLLLWPGMDVRPFAASSHRALSTPASEWGAALAKMIAGLGLAFLAGGFATEHPTVAAWVGWMSLLLAIHCGAFRLLALAWQRAGVDARPIVDRPLAADSLADFWGRRWNLAFRDAAHRFVFRPLVGRIGVNGAMVATFVFSGLVHDVAMSLPAGGGYGLPTLYFMIQGAGMLVERRFDSLRRVNRKSGWHIVGRLWTIVDARFRFRSVAAVVSRTVYAPHHRADAARLRRRELADIFDARLQLLEVGHDRP